MKTEVKELKALLQDDSRVPDDWALKAIVNDDSLSYLAWNRSSLEAIVVDPMREDAAKWKELGAEISKLRVLAVIDTHTHADHVSWSAKLAEEWRAPFIMHQLSPSSRVHLRVSRDAAFPAIAGAIRFLETPGHAPDSVVVLWGPFLFTGDTILYGDTGRDDLPGGDPEAHYRSLRKIEAAVTPATVVLPGHDCEGGRASSWKTQMGVNSSLRQSADEFVRDSRAYVGPLPKAFEESMSENSK